MPDDDYIKGRGTQYNSHNPFEKQRLTFDVDELLDEEYSPAGRTEYIPVYPKTIVNEVKSPDIGPAYSMNPYQGCEHGCVYCYARPTHHYWGYSAGVDFEKKILVKEKAPELLAKKLKNRNWKPMPIMLSGNTDCYQPAERKFGITRRILKVLLKFKHPVGIITKNALILRDLDILKQLAELNLIAVNISLTTFNEELRRYLEPRTASGLKRLNVVKTLSEAGIPVNVMIAPVIPALNSYEIPDILKRTSEAGARSAHYLVVRLNDEIGELFTDWVKKNYPDRAEKVLGQVRSMHNGSLEDKSFKTRMRGVGKESDMIAQLFKVNRDKYFKGKAMPSLNYSLYHHTNGDAQTRLFD